MILAVVLTLLGGFAGASVSFPPRQPLDLRVPVPPTTVIVAG